MKGIGYRGAEHVGNWLKVPLITGTGGKVGRESIVRAQELRCMVDPGTLGAKPHNGS